MPGFASDFALAALVTLTALVAVLVPFSRGLALCFRARSATRRVSRAELRKTLETPGAGHGSIAALMARVLAKSLREGGDHPRDFVLDASRQYAENEYDAHYARVISMYANLLPPIGFIGTTAGLFVLFLSMHVADEALELSALSAALTSSIFALVGFAVLEGLKIRLYARMLVCLDDVVALGAGSDSKKKAA